MPSSIFHDRQLVQRLHQAYADKTESVYRGLQQAADAADGICIRTFGATRVFIAPGHDWTNRATLIGDESFEQIDQIVAFFAAQGQRCHIEWNPGNCHRPDSWNDELGPYLLKLGFRPHGFRCVFVRDTALGAAAMHPNLTVRRFGPDDLDEYVALAARIEQKSAPQKSALCTEVLHGQAGARWNHYVGYLDGTPCCVASSYHGHDTACLEWATTHPDFRRRGCQRTLIRRRVADAAASACTLAFAVTDIGTQSGRNLQHQGFQLAYNYVMLTKDP